MKNFILKFLDWISLNQKGILFIIEWILIILFIGMCIVLSLLVLLQRGEEGAFSKNRGDKVSSDNKTLMRATIICSLCLFFGAMLLNGVIHKNKHIDIKNNNTTTDVVKK